MWHEGGASEGLSLSVSLSLTHTHTLSLSLSLSLLTSLVEGSGWKQGFGVWGHPGDNLGANLKSISHRCYPILVAIVWELTENPIHLPLPSGWV